MFRLEHADCLEFLYTLPDGSVDAVICDPPYNTTALTYDRQPLNWPRLWLELYRVCKPAAQMVFFSAQPFTTMLINSNPRDFRLERIWVKSRKTGHLNSAWRPLQQHENILVFCRKPMRATYNPQTTTGTPKGTIRRRQPGSPHYGAQVLSEYVDEGVRQPTTVMTYPSVQRGVLTHESQKPLELLRELVLTYSNPGDTVLDFCAGSGTTGAACLLTKRTFWGCEINADYHRLANRRLETIRAQPDLEFDLEPPSEMMDAPELSIPTAEVV